MTLASLIPGTLGNFALLLGAFALLILGAEIFTNAVEWFGHHLGVSESATGSLIAAVGTALPETMIPVIAILAVVLGRGDQAVADEVGVGAILGAPFMLATIAMFLVGCSLLYFRSRREVGAVLDFELSSTKRDLSFFLVGYGLAVAAAFLPSQGLRWFIGLALVGTYLIYARRTLGAGKKIAGHDLESLHLVGILNDVQRPFPPVGSSRIPIDEPTLRLVSVQMGVALLVIIAGAHLFVTEVQFFAGWLGVPAAIVALLLAPLATELPEKFNSVIWTAEGKDTLALGNITGAMVFQSTLPATLGILFTAWDLGIEWGTIGFLNGLSAGMALLAGSLLLGSIAREDSGRLGPWPLLFGGLLYALFVIIAVYHVTVLDVTAIRH